MWDRGSDAVASALSEILQNNKKVFAKEVYAFWVWRLVWFCWWLVWV